MTRLLFKNGGKVDYIDALLADVILNSHPSTAAGLTRILLENGANPNYNRAASDHAFVFLDAVKRDDYALVQVLVQSGADVNVKGLGQRGALHEACKKGNTAIVKLLLERGVDVDAKYFIFFKGIVQKFIVFFFDPFLFFNRASSAENRSFTESVNTPLFELIEIGTANGKRERTDPSESLEIAKLLIEKGADVNATGYVPWDWDKTNPKGFTDATLLEYAQKLNAGGLVKLFLKNGAKKHRNPPYKTFTFYSKEDYEAFKVWWNQHLQSKQKK